MTAVPRISVNPLQFAATDDGWFDFESMPSLQDLLAQVRGAGFRAIAASPPTELAPAEYVRLIGAAGLSLGPGYLAIETDEGGVGELGDALGSDIRRFADCGVTIAFLGLGVHPGSRRFDRPAVGVDASDARIARVAELLDQVCEQLERHGMKGALHPHIASWVETEQETRAVLDRTSLLRFGPDLGHLAWARADVAALLRDYADRVIGVHVKDYNEDILTAALLDGRDYATTVASGLWADPGHGDGGIGSSLALVTDDVPLVVEVDRAPDRDPAASLRRSAAWAGSR